MARLTWSAVGERFYESGVDRGVLYTTNGEGVVWNGLVSVSEIAVGGQIREHFLDGIKYLHFVSGEDFGATIEALTYPDEFEKHDGTTEATNGLMVMHQTRSPFGLSYRTMIGNDLEGTDYAYKIHIIYNAVAAPTHKVFNTVGETMEPTLFSWEISTRPPEMQGYKPSAHFVIDSRKTPSGLLAQIEDILYGSDTELSRQPTAQELLDLFKNYVVPSPTDPEPNPDPTADEVLDGGTVTEESNTTYDAGTHTSDHVSVLDGGGP